MATDLERAIKNNAPPAVIKMLKRRERMEHGKSKQQQEMDALFRKIDAETTRLPSQLLDLTRKFNSRLPETICSTCGQPTRGNLMNGVPYCFKCASGGIRVINKSEAIQRCLKEFIQDGLP